MKRNLLILSTFLFPFLLSAANFKSVSDGRRDATEVIQKAINDCNAAGGGDVVLPVGTYLCKTIHLRSHVNLVVGRGATIKGSTNYAGDYTRRALILAENIEDFGICGDGTIDGQANLLDFKASGFKNNDKIRPYIIHLVNCENFRVKDIHLVNSARWTFRISQCIGGIVDRVTISSLEYINNDGIDIDGKDIVVSNCIINSDDDAICLKSDDPDFLVENIAITNCILASNSNPIKMGTSGRAGFKNISISNCVIRPNPKSQRRDIWKDYRNIDEGVITGLSGVAIESVDGGVVENITVSNISMSGITSPIFLCLGRRKSVSTLRDISISNITAVVDGVLPCVICGLPEKKIENVRLSNINIVRKNGDVAMGENPTEAPKSYPEARMYGHQNPAFGIYARHVDGLYVDNLTVRSLAEVEQRPLIVLDDVCGESLSRLKAIGTTGAEIERR